MSNTFITADLHLNHRNIIFHCGRTEWIKPNPYYDENKPYHFKFNNQETVDLKRHDDNLIDNWNSLVTRNDYVWILGDFAWKYHSTFLNRLHGKKFLIRGNHDKMSVESFRQFNKIQGAHFRYSFYTQINGRRIMLSHAPYLTWFSSCYGSWNLHGHCHGRLEEKDHILRMDVGVDVWDFKPIPWDIIEKKMTKREKIRKEMFSENSEPSFDIRQREEFFKSNRENNLKYLQGG